MWYYESLANQWPAPSWATDSQRFATCNVIMVQFLHCTIIILEPILGKISVPDLLFGSTWLCHSYEPLRISGPRRRRPLIGQRFVVPQYSRPTPNQWPKNLRSADLPTDSFHLKTPLRERGFSLGVLIASCTANLNVHQISYWQARTAAQTRCARNYHTNLNPRYKNSPSAGAPVNKTKPKAPLPQEGFGMSLGSL